MFVVRDELLARFEQDARRRFHSRVLAFLREQMAEELGDQNDDEVLAFIDQEHTCAEANDVHTERGVVQWICLSMVYGSNFTHEPAFNTYFDSPAETMEAKLHLLTACLETLGRNSTIQVHNLIRT